MSSISQHNPARIFVSHVFEKSDDYLRVFEYLESAHNFYYRNSSAPDVAPSSPDKEGMRERLRQEITQSEVVVILAGLYRAHREWIDFEINCAKGLDKPVIVLEVFGVKEKLPVQLEALADEVIEWDDRTLTDAIRRQARHEDTTRWDVIEFKLD